jgi:hydrogenase/urease accessory protein HupE
VSRRLSLLFLAALVCVAQPAPAHELRPGYLEIREVSQDRFDVLWKVPARGEYRLAMSVRLPEPCTDAARRSSLVGAAFVERWRAECPGGLAGRTISIEGLRATRTDVLVRLERLDGAAQTLRLTPEQTSFEMTAAVSRRGLASTYFLLGVEHILLGADHVLFVLGLLFLVGSWTRLIGTVTAFTLAHSVTLAASALGLVHLAQAPVEATIALSVVFVAAEILRGARGRPGFAARAPWVVACAFGLLHGFGFAGALREVGLPERDIPLALLLFNVGVEAGQLLFVAAAVAVLSSVVHLVDRREPTGSGPWHTRPALRIPVAYGVGSLAAFWVVQRIAAFWP